MSDRENLPWDLHDLLEKKMVPIEHRDLIVTTLRHNISSIIYLLELAGNRRGRQQLREVTMAWRERGAEPFFAEIVDPDTLWSKKYYPA